MTVSTTLLPDGSISLTDGATSYPPLSPEAVQAIAEQAAASAAAHKTQAMAEALTGLARLITTAAPAAGTNAYAQVTVTPGAAVAVLDDVSFAVVRDALPGDYDAAGNWVAGPLTVQKKAPPTPTPDPGGTP